MHLIKAQLRDFSAAHRLIHGYKGKCKDLHGHNYSVRVAFHTQALNKHGFVVDFSDVKEYCNAWIQDNWDHGTIVSEDDYDLLEFLKYHKQKYYVLPKEVNSTVENMAEYLFHKLTAIFEAKKMELNNYAKLVEIEITETESSSAVYTQA